MISTTLLPLLSVILNVIDYTSNYSQGGSVFGAKVETPGDGDGPGVANGARVGTVWL